MREEIRRKAFHLLILLYLFYYLLGGPLWLFWSWNFLTVLAEFLRLRLPGVNERLVRLFSPVIREEEKKQASGMPFTALGCALTFSLFGSEPRIVSASLLALVFGDSAAALAGKAWGRRSFQVRGRIKSLEGSLACFAVCLAVFWALDFSFIQILVGAAACAFLEVLPLPYSDNLWIPLGTALALKASNL